MTFAGAPEVQMAVTWVSTSGDGDLMCRWIAGGIPQVATFPEACLTLVRPADPKERERLDEGRLRILRRVHEDAEFMRRFLDGEFPSTKEAELVKVIHASLVKLLRDEGWK